MPCVARGSPSLMPISGALWSPLSGAAAGRPCRPPRAHLPVGAAPPAAGAAIACLGRGLAGASAAGGGPGGLALPDARAAALGHAQGGNDAACERAKQQDYAAMVYARSRTPSFLRAGVAARAR
jgi:hypothetical protein